jgi:hypothetical protein
MPTPYKDQDWAGLVTIYRGLWRILEGHLEPPRDKEWKQHRWKRFKSTQADFELLRPAQENEIAAFLALMQTKTGGVLRM